jgi:hypothetical protein
MLKKQNRQELSAMKGSTFTYSTEYLSQVLLLPLFPLLSHLPLLLSPSTRVSPWLMRKAIGRQSRRQRRASGQQREASSILQSKPEKSSCSTPRDHTRRGLKIFDSLMNISKRIHRKLAAKKFPRNFLLESW